MHTIKLLRKYKHFKGKEYLTLGISYPTDKSDFNDKVEVQHTETNKQIDIFIGASHDAKIYQHSEEEFDGLFVIYIALYDDYKLYARPYNMFSSKVDRNKYPDVKQTYRFEEM